jgi:hypothetical protein
MNSMEKSKRINQKYDQGILDGIAGIYKPGVTFGIFRKVYHTGNKQGRAIRRLTKNKLTDFKIK